jgi:hypothetical protein
MVICLEIWGSGLGYCINQTKKCNTKPAPAVFRTYISAYLE